MQCQNCQHDNRKTAKFCEECGAKLPQACPACGHQVRPQARFCDSCGARLVDVESTPNTVGASAESSTTPKVTEAERRQVTVLFCDLVGSTPLSEQLDPEVLREVLREYQSVCAKVITRFDGHIARYFGDGILVYFGYPVAHEDDAQRAVRSGLGIVQAMQGVNTRLQQDIKVLRFSPLQVRLGIHTGLVVAGDIDDATQRLESMAIIGGTPNIAARLQSIAEPNALVISAETHRLIAGFFECQSLGAHTLRGISEPVTVYQVFHESTARSRLDVAEISGLTPLTGRAREVATLVEHWDAAKAGNGHVILLHGEAGLGKSRLVRALKEHISQEPNAWFTECRCSPYHQNSAFYPIVELFERVILQFERDEKAAEKQSKIEGFLVQYGFALDEMMPLFASFLSVPLNERYPPLSITPERQKQKLIETLLSVLLLRASQQPVLLVIEDLHWVDPSTLEFITLIIDQKLMTQLMIVLTFRPEFNPPWGVRSRLYPIPLESLPAQQTEAIIHQMTGDKALPEEVIEQIVQRTDGVPLFVEELTKMVLESGLIRELADRYELIGPLPSLAIPATLHDSLVARLDKLAAVKEIAQLGATLAREFDYELISAVSPLDEIALQNGLTQLVRAGLLYQRGIPPTASYQFKHALIQDAAYQSLLISSRQQHHLQIAQVLEARFPDKVETAPELVAHHYTEAGIVDKAIHYLQKAGEQAVRSYANQEAIAAFSSALDLLKSLDDTTQRAEQELDLQIALGPVFRTVKGYNSPEVLNAYSRARELCQQVGQASQTVPVLCGLSSFYSVLPELQTAWELAEQSLRLAEGSGDSVLLLPSHRAMGTALFWLGEFAPAKEHLEQGIALYNRKQHQSLSLVYGTHPAGACLSYAAWIQWILGYPSQALQRVQDSLTLAREVSHPFSLGFALDFAAICYQFRREVDAALEQAEVAIILSTEHEIPQWLTMGTIMRGWALTSTGQEEEGMQQMSQGMATWRSMGTEVIRPYFLCLLAGAYGEVGQASEGLTMLHEALAAVEKTGECWWETELYRVKGELLLMPREKEDLVEQRESGPSVAASSPDSDEKEAETCFHKALSIARRQGAKSLELRAAMSLSRLWQKQSLPRSIGSRKQEALAMLQKIYSWFTEGFDTADLKEAKALLKELSTDSL